MTAAVVLLGLLLLLPLNVEAFVFHQSYPCGELGRFSGFPSGRLTKECHIGETCRTYDTVECEHERTTRLEDCQQAYMGARCVGVTAAKITVCTDGVLAERERCRAAADRERDACAAREERACLNFPAQSTPMPESPTP